MGLRIVSGLREEFREVSESGHVYFYFGDETVSPLDAEDRILAGSTIRHETAGYSYQIPSTVLRPC